MAELKITRKQILEKDPNIGWMDTMVLNPAIIEKDGVIHMLFRATGTNNMKKTNDKSLPFPICLGYGKSTDGGKTWSFDTTRPALFPAVKSEQEDLYIKNKNGECVINHSNGCIEDPRLFYVEGTCYMTAACRIFSPGAYWVKDDPMQLAPDWAKGEHLFGRTASENITVTVLYEVDLDLLEKGDYENAFTYITNLTTPEFGENRDVILFPEKMKIDGKLQYVMIERPSEPNLCPGIDEQRPSIVICAAENLEDFSDPKLKRKLYAAPKYEWEKEKVGAGANLVKINEKYWLLNYHGKQDAEVGYTQSFMVLENVENDFPKIVYRSGERLITAVEDWEKCGNFKIPCVFITGMIKYKDELILSYGAADERVGIMHINYDELMNYLKNSAE